MAAKSTESMLGLPSPDFNLQYSTNLRHSKRGGRLFGCTPRNSGSLASSSYDLQNTSDGCALAQSEYAHACSVILK